ncbi:MAG: BTAD domain-containing putative transcriptional regulator [Acidimicrobiia bacterium]|nr:BTAD domain-containing putative transcriptional regulator [Acidimicrobiia bacterium]
MLKVGLLGPFEVTVDEQPVAVDAKTQRKLLAILALEVGAELSLDRISEDLWGDELPSEPKSALRFHIHKLRSTLGEFGDRLVTRPKAYLLDVPAEDVDVNRFYTLVNAGSEALRSGNPSTAAMTIDTALLLWRGTPLVEFAYDDFAQTELRRLEEARALALQTRYEAALQVGDSAGAVSDLAGLVEEYPYREGLWALYMTALHRTGRSVEALREAQRFRERLVEETGLEPGGVFLEAENAILINDPTSPEVATVESGILPAPIGSLIGREDELRELMRRIGTARLVSITGPPGVGKSHLALAAVRELERAKAVRSYFVDASAIADGAELAGAVAAAVGAGDVASVGELASVVAAAPGVVLVDGLADDAEGAGDVMTELLRLSPALAVLVTTTAPLGIRGEARYRLRPLTSRSAAELFEDRWTGAPLDTTEVADICESVGNLPLGVELMAANYLPGLDWVDAARSPAADLDASIQALLEQRSDSQRSALGRIAIVDGWFTATDAVAIGQCSPDDLQALAKGSLLVGPREDGLFSVLDPVRRVASSGLGDNQVAEARSALLDLALAEMRAQRTGPSSATARVAPLIRWAADQQDRRAIDGVALLSGRLWRHGSTTLARDILSSTLSGVDWEPSHSLEEALFFATICAVADGDLPEAVRYSERHSVIADQLGGPRSRAFAIQLNASILLEQGRLGDAITAQQNAVDIWRQLDDIELATALGSLGYLLARASEAERAADILDEIDRVAARHDVDLAGAQREGVQAWLAMWAGDADGARRHLQNQREQYAALDHAQGLMVALQHASWLEIAMGRNDRGLSYAQDALRLGKDIGRTGTEPALYSLIAIANSLAGDAVAGQAALCRSLRVDRPASSPEDTLWALRAAAIVERSRGGGTPKLVGAAASIQTETGLAYPPLLESWWVDATAAADVDIEASVEVGLFRARQVSRSGQYSD